MDSIQSLRDTIKPLINNFNPRINKTLRETFGQMAAQNATIRK